LVLRLNLFETLGAGPRIDAAPSYGLFFYPAEEKNMYIQYYTIKQRQYYYIEPFKVQMQKFPYLGWWP
jgi:hypothetical protein